MIEKYKSVAGETVTEKIIEKSRFITVSRHMCGDDGAKSFIAEVSKKHAAATHNCYAYVADNLGNLLRFSDDGEPQGTAGLPILGVIKAKNLFCTAVAVVRYFGGVKLGAGGLTRAYCGCAQEGLCAADIREFAPCVEITLEVSYGEVNAAMQFLERGGYAEYRKEFGAGARFTASVREEKVAEFQAAAREYLNGRVEITAGDKHVYPFAAQR